MEKSRGVPYMVDYLIFVMAMVWYLTCHLMRLLYDDYLTIPLHNVELKAFKNLLQRIANAWH